MQKENAFCLIIATAKDMPDNLDAIGHFIEAYRTIVLPDWLFLDTGSGVVDQQQF